MENKKVYKQVIKKELIPIEVAKAYYAILCTLAKIHLSQRELELLAYIATRGTISSVSARDEFCKQFNSTKQTINNIVSKLKKSKLLVKEQNKIRITNSIRLDFNNDVNLNITLESLTNEEEND